MFLINEEISNNINCCRDRIVKIYHIKNILLWLDKESNVPGDKPTRFSWTILSLQQGTSVQLDDDSLDDPAQQLVTTHR